VARKTFSKELKARVALEALRSEKTVAQISSEYGVHATQVNAWRKQALEGLPELFGCGSEADAKANEAQKEQLYQQIGKLQVEVEWLRKKSRQLGLT
jgi:transposase-like protein